MRRALLVFAILVLCSVIGAQDNYDILGDGGCETVIDVIGVGNTTPIYVEVSQNDAPLAGFYVEDAAQGIYRLPAGVVSYRVSVQAEPGDSYTIGARQDCPPAPIDPELSDEDLSALLLSQLSPYAPAFMDQAYFEWLIWQFGRDEAARRVTEMNQLIADFLAQQPTQPPDTIPTLTPTPELTLEATPAPTQEINATPEG